jgi:hypothetical protein
MRYEQFVEIVPTGGYSVPQLRCDLPPSEAILEFIGLVGVDYEGFVIRYTTIRVTAIRDEYRDR